MVEADFLMCEVQIFELQLVKESRVFSLIGGGWAGTLMGIRLLSEGKQVYLFDSFRQESASNVAAGLFNIITGRFGALTWQASLLLNEIQLMLADEVFGLLKPYVHYADIYRPFKEVEEYNKWLGRIHEEAYVPFVSFQEQTILKEKLNNSHGGILIHKCGWIEVRKGIEVLKKYIANHPKGALINEDIGVHQIHLDKKYIKGKDDNISFDEIIFCEGYRGHANPLWKHVKIIPNKGELLVIYSKELELPFVLSRKIYVIPGDSNSYIVGATYAREFENIHPSRKGREELEKYILDAIKVPYRIMGHFAGIRPTTPNRRPIVGTHPEWPNVHICTGFGSKGVLYGPYCTRILLNSILGKEQVIPPTMNVNRFC